jgi:hypothetical protein
MAVSMWVEEEGPMAAEWGGGRVVLVGAVQWGASQQKKKE